MNGGGGRQLPSWMLRQCTVEQTSNSEVKQQNDSEALDAKTCLTQKKVQRRKHNSDVPLLENKSQVHEKCEARSRDKKSSLQEAVQHDEEPYLLKPGRTVKRKRTNKRRNDQGSDLPKSNLEADDGSRRKIYRGNSSGKKKKKKTGVSMEGSYDGTVPSEDELTVEDLVSIAEEYVSADMMELENLQLNSKTRSVKDPTAHRKDMEPHTHNPLSTKSFLTDPIDTGDPAQDMLDLLLGGFVKRSMESERKNDALTKKIILNHDDSSRSRYDTVGEVVPVVRKKASLKDKVLTDPVDTGDPAQDMLDLLLGGFLKRSMESERSNDAITENIILDHDVSRKSQYDTVVEVVPVVRKKASLKDKVAMLLN